PARDQPPRYNTSHRHDNKTRQASDATGHSQLPVGILREEMRAGRVAILPTRPRIEPHQGAIAYRQDFPGGALARLATLIKAIVVDSDLAHYRPTR
ncbi:MAG: hypothetical protein AB7O55_16665, partial [Lautropia sp.]